jgi:hypothetical protein
LATDNLDRKSLLFCCADFVVKNEPSATSTINRALCAQRSEAQPRVCNFVEYERDLARALISEGVLFGESGCKFVAFISSEKILEPTARRY